MSMPLASSQVVNRERRALPLALPSLRTRHPHERRADGNAAEPVLSAPTLHVRRAWAGVAAATADNTHYGRSVVNIDEVSRSVQPPASKAGGQLVPLDATADGAPRIGETWRLKESNILVRVTSVVQLGRDEPFVTGYEVMRGGVLGNYRSLRFSRLAQCVSTGE